MLKFQKEVNNNFNIDVKAGRAIFDSNCAACHGFTGDAKSASAPPLGGVFGRKAGTTAFPHSK